MNYFGINMDCIAIMKWLTGPGLKDFWVPLMQILSPFIAASAVIFQINRNHRNNLVLETKKVKNEIESKLYAEIDEKMEAAGDLIQEAYSYVNKIFFSLTSQQAAMDAGLNPMLPKERPLEINARQFAASNGIASLIKVIEKYEIVQPGLKIFQKALNVCAHDMLHEYTRFMKMLCASAI